MSSAYFAAYLCRLSAGRTLQSQDIPESAGQKPAEAAAGLLYQPQVVLLNSRASLQSPCGVSLYEIQSFKKVNSPNPNSVSAGSLPRAWAQVPLQVLNVSDNALTGDTPPLPASNCTFAVPLLSLLGDGNYLRGPIHLLQGLFRQSTAHCLDYPFLSLIATC